MRSSQATGSSLAGAIESFANALRLGDFVGSLSRVMPSLSKNARRAAAISSHGYALPNDNT